MSYEVKEQQLMDYFKEQNFEPVRARLLYDNEGNSKGTGFVELSNPDAAESACKKLNESFWQGRKLSVNFANNK